MNFSSIKYSLAISLMTIVIASTTLCSCSEGDSDDALSLGAPQSSLDVANPMANSLTINWPAVKGAYEYGCKLLDANNNIFDCGIIGDTTTTINYLMPATDYKFVCTAYSLLADNQYQKSSKDDTLSVKTADINVNAVVSGPVVTLTSGNFYDVDSVKYVITDSENNLITTMYANPEEETEVTLDKLGTYNVYVSSIGQNFDTVRVACPTYAFDITELKGMKWEVEGTVTAPGCDEVKATLQAYTDGTYIIKGWLGGSLDLEFSINNDYSIATINHYDYYWGYYYVMASEANEPVKPYMTQVYTAGGYSAAYDSNNNKTTKLEKAGGSINMYAYIYDHNSKVLGNGYYTFSW